MANPKLQQTYVDSIDVSSYVTTWKITRQKDSKISTASVRFNNNIQDVVNFDQDNVYHTIQIWRGVTTATERKIFKGQIYSFAKDGAYINCSCKDELYKAVRAEVTKSFDKNIDTEAGKCSAIFSTLMETYAGLTATVGDSVTDSGSVNVISKFVCNHADPFERAERLRELLDWQFYYEPNTDKVYFEPQGTSAATIIMTVGSNVTNLPVWKYDTTKLVNKYTIIGGEELVEKEQTFDGATGTTTFTLANTPVSVRMEVGGVLQVGGNDTTSTTFDYSVDRETKIITFEAASEPASGSNNVKAIYTHLLPRPVVATNDSSITIYGDHKKTDFATELKDINDVKAYAKKYVNIYGVPFLSTKLGLINAEDVFPGQIVNVVDYNNAINKNVYINSVEMVYPYTADSVSVGDEELRTKPLAVGLNDRLRRLEEELGKNTDKLSHLFDASKTIKYKPRYFKINRRQVAGMNNWIWGNPVYGVWGTSKWGDVDGYSATTTQYLMQGNNEYREFCYDEDFHDGTSSTATFNTGTKQITFTANQLWQSEKLFKGTTFNYATLDCKKATGSFKYEITADNKINWQTLTLGTRTTITNADNLGVYLLITETAGTTATVDRTVDVYGRQTEPAISLFMEE